MLFFLLLPGEEVERAKSQLVEAMEWLRKAGEMGSIEASYHLGTLYEQGSSAFPPDPVIAFRHYKRAADATPQVGSQGGRERGEGGEENDGW